jgi:hypothetical protein
MSREFGHEYGGKFFLEHIECAYEDCTIGRDELTKLWGEFLREFYEVAYEISRSEAGDSGPDAPIMESIERMPTLQARLDKIKEYLQPFKAVAEAAVRKATEKNKP